MLNKFGAKVLMYGVAAVWALASFAASPPALVNYQGVLRDASNMPLTGNYDMVFRFWSASSGGWPPRPPG